MRIDPYIGRGQVQHAHRPYIGGGQVQQVHQQSTSTEVKLIESIDMIDNNIPKKNATTT